MHAYEYIVGRDGRIVAIIVLEPSRGVAEVLDLSGGRYSADLRALIRSVDPSVAVAVRSARATQRATSA